MKVDPIPVPKMKQPPKFIKSEESRAKFAVETEFIAEEGLKLLAEGADVKMIIKKVDRKMKKALYKSHKRIKPNKAAVIQEDEDIFWTLTKNLEKEVKL